MLYKTNFKNENTTEKKFKITTLEVAGILPAMIGMRNPKKSWHLNDTVMCYRDCDDCYIESAIDCPKDGSFDDDWVCIGKNDMRLAQTLLSAGAEHAKYMRQIQVWANFDMPLYWWSEFDTYHFNTKNSESTMHKLLTSGAITKDMFAYCEEDSDILQMVIDRLNEIRIKYNDKNTDCNTQARLLVRAKRLLSCGWFQLRMVSTNYAEIRNMWLQRVKNPHRLKEEWVDTFGEWVATLPYAKELIMHE